MNNCGQENTVAFHVLFTCRRDEMRWVLEDEDTGEFFRGWVWMPERGWGTWAEAGARVTPVPESSVPDWLLQEFYR